MATDQQIAERVVSEWCDEIVDVQFSQPAKRLLVSKIVSALMSARSHGHADNVPHPSGGADNYEHF